MLAVGEDASVARSMLKRALTAYVTVPQYNKFFQEIGYENEAGKAMELWNKGDRKQALESIPDTMVERIFVYGDAKTCRKRIDEYFAAGVTTTALQFISFSQNTEERRARVLKGMEDFANA
jgi:alkanesulfonate monooxygenase SsuD/methylene tetrahydromethanopterin reductase-like flavin-dependent oxidoreductase (luciferase family)